MDNIIEAIKQLRIKHLSTKTEIDFVIMNRLDDYLSEAERYLNLAKNIAKDYKIEL